MAGGWLQYRGEAARARLADLDRGERVLRVKGTQGVSRHRRRVRGLAVVSRHGRRRALWPGDQGRPARPRQAGIPPVSPHDFRKTLLSTGVDVFTVQRMAGHANPQTTSRYDSRPEEEARAAAEFLHLPYHRGTVARKATPRGT